MPQAGVTARSLHTHAVSFFEAAEAVRKSGARDPLPKCFLWGRAIELLLKSHLLAEGFSIKQLKSSPFGHDLEALFTAARSRGISGVIGNGTLNPGLVNLLNFDYLSKRFEYRVSGGTYHLPDSALTRQLINRLIRGIDFQLTRKHGV